MKKILLSISTICIMAALACAESCTTVGEIGKKYTPEGSCSYKTQKRICCPASGNSKEWSEWTEGEVSLETSCENDGCWNGQEWEPKPEAKTFTLSADSANINNIRRGGNAGMALAQKLSSSSSGEKYKIVGTVYYDRKDCTCTSEGWKCGGNFRYLLMKASWIQHSKAGYYPESFFISHSSECSNYEIEKYLHETNPGICGSNFTNSKLCKDRTESQHPYSGEVTESNFVSVCENTLVSWAINSRHDNVPAGAWCETAVWDRVETKNFIVQKQCNIYGLRLAGISCHVEKGTITKRSDDESSWFGE